MKKLYTPALILLTLLTLLALAMGGYALFWLLQIRQMALDAQQVALRTVADARALVAGIGDDSFSYTVTIRRDIPVQASIPFRHDFTVPIHATIPISTVVIIPVNAGLLGTFDIDVPVRTMIPVHLEVTVPVSQTVAFSTTVPLNLDVPVEIPLSDTPLTGYLEELDAALGQLEEGLGQLGSTTTQ
ncbi:MAG: hypothetical protein N2508_01075 [Anaerolineae bacterium]|nr:hypothetical protein [Anaerolineae bacterium]